MKRIKRLLALVLSVALMTTMVVLPGEVFAREDGGEKDYSGLEEIARQFQDETKDAFAFRSSKGSSALSLKSEKNYPDKLDLRNVDGECYVTPVKFQNPFGTCWGFAAIAAAETSILGSGIAKDDGYNWQNLDLSEKHLVNFIARPIADKSSSQYGEGMYYDEKYAKTLEDKFNFGGLPIYASTLFASGIGPNLEDRSIPASAPEGTPSDIYEYHGLSREIEKELINGVWTDYCYTDNDDWSIPEELRETQSYVMKESFMLPSPAQFEYDDPDDESSDVHYVYNEDGTNAFKEQLMNNRAVEIGFYADQSTPNQENDRKYLSRNWAHYTYEEADANHAVTIVGYDDNYPKENFVVGHEPPADGAWLVKNSWGSGEEEFPNRGGGNWGIPNEDGKGTGYFWLSYYDQSLSLPEAVEFEESNVGKEYYIDQYDYMPVQEINTAEVDDLACMANIFTAEQNETLEQISCQTAAPGTKVEYTVLVLSPGFESPLDGIPVAVGNAEFEYGGFHKIKLEEPALIQKGQSFSIVVTQTVAGKSGKEMYSVNVQASEGEEWAKLNDEAEWVKGVINPKESFIMADGDWYDMADEKTLEALFGSFYMLYTYDNFPIKAYSKPAAGYHFYATPNPLKIDPYGSNSSKTISLTLSGGKGEMPDSKDITWEIPEGHQNVFNIKVNTSRPTRCQVSAIKPGSGYIKVSFPGIGTLAVRVEVSRNGGYNAPAYGLEYGETFKINELYDIYENPVTDFGGFSFTSEDPSIVTVTGDGVMKAVGLGETNIIVSDVMGAEGKIEVYTHKAVLEPEIKGKKVTVSYKKLKSKAQKVVMKKALTIKNMKGKKTYKKVSGNKGFSVNKKTGKITVKKGLKKGTYKVKIKVSAAGNKYYEKSSGTGTVTIKIK